MGRNQALLDGVLLKDCILRDTESRSFMIYDWNPMGGFFIDEHKRVRSAGGVRWAARYVEFDSPAEFDRCMYKALRAAAQAHLISMPKVDTAQIEAHLWRLGQQHCPIAQLICRPEDADRLLQLVGDRRVVHASPIIPKKVIYALGEDVGLSPGTRDWKVRGIAVRNPGRVFAFKRVGNKWPPESPRWLQE